MSEMDFFSAPDYEPHSALEEQIMYPFKMPDALVARLLAGETVSFREMSDALIAQREEEEEAEKRQRHE